SRALEDRGLSRRAEVQCCLAAQRLVTDDLERRPGRRARRAQRDEADAVRVLDGLPPGLGGTRRPREAHKACPSALANLRAWALLLPPLHVRQLARQTNRYPADPHRERCESALPPARAAETGDREGGRRGTRVEGASRTEGEPCEPTLAELRPERPLEVARAARLALRETPALPPGLRAARQDARCSELGARGSERVTPSSFTESEVEEVALGWLGELGYEVLQGPEIAYGERSAERTDP